MKATASEALLAFCETRRRALNAQWNIWSKFVFQIDYVALNCLKEKLTFCQFLSGLVRLYRNMIYEKVLFAMHFQS